MGVAKRAEDRRLIVFKVAYSICTERRLTKQQAAELRDRRVSRASHRATPVDEVMATMSE